MEVSPVGISLVRDCLNIISDQSQSPLFQIIPAEIREAIYSYYVYEENGYFYNASTQRLSLENTKPIELNLMYTCKIANHEMKGVALRINKVTFFPGDHYAKSNFYQGLKSKAARLRLLFTRIATTRRQMLLWAEDCVKASMLHQVIAMFGKDGQHLADAFKAVKDAREEAEADDRLLHDGAELLGEWITDWDMETSAGFQRALQHLLYLSSEHTDFRSLAMKAFDPEANASLDWHTLFKPEAYALVLSWSPPTWIIPSDADLIAWEDLFLEIGHPGPLLCWDAEETMSPLKWHFSAAAIAIDFIDRHRLGSQMRNMILSEDLISVSNPECHAQGLARLLTENPMLRICRSISILSGVFPRGRHYFQLHLIDGDLLGILGDETNEELYVNSDLLLLSLVPWLDEANSLPSQLPSKSFELVFGGPIDDTILAWDFIRQVAMLQDAHLEHFRRRGTVPPLPNQSSYFQRKAYPLPCHLPTGFLQVVKDIIRGTRTGIRFQDSVGEMWDLDATMREREEWTPVHWKDEWQKFMNKYVTLVGAGMTARTIEYLAYRSS